MFLSEEQRRKDHRRKSYRITFPTELNPEQVMAWLRSISGTLKGSWLTKPTIVLEMWGTSNGIAHIIKIPYQHADYVVNQLTGHIPGIWLTPEEEFPQRVWVVAQEFSLSLRDRQLFIPEPEHLSTTLLDAVQLLKETETVLLQWIISPLPRQHLPEGEVTSDRLSFRHLLAGNVAGKDEISDRRQKLTDVNFAAVLRVGAVAHTTIRANHLVDNVRKALASSEAAGVHFNRRKAIPKELLQQRIDGGGTPLHWPIQLAAPELTALLGWPLGNGFVAGMPQRLARKFPPTQNVPTTGMVIGNASFSGMERKVAIGFEEALMHTHILGSTGTGKSSLLGHMARQIMEHGYGLILIESEGDLYQSVLDYIPPQRLEDVIIFDVTDREHPIGFNVLDQGNPDMAVTRIIELFEHKYGNGLWAEGGLYHGLRMLLETPGTSLTDLPTLLNPRTPSEVDWSDAVGRSIKDYEVKRWWNAHDNRNRKEQLQRTTPIIDRISMLTSRPELRYIMGQSTSTFKMQDVIDHNKILLMNFKGVSHQTSALAQTLALDTIWEAIKTGQNHKANYVMLDEFGEFMDLPIGIAKMFAQARKYGAGFIVANQDMGQIKKQDVREGIITNARNKVIFACNADDARDIGREYGKQVEVEDLTRLAKHEALAQVQTSGGTSSPVSIKTLAPQLSSGLAREAIRHSRAKYTRPLKEVQAEIEGRHKVPKADRKQRPSIGSEQIDTSFG